MINELIFPVVSKRKKHAFPSWNVVNVVVSNDFEMSEFLCGPCSNL